MHTSRLYTFICCYTWVQLNYNLSSNRTNYLAQLCGRFFTFCKISTANLWILWQNLPTEQHVYNDVWKMLFVLHWNIAKYSKLPMNWLPINWAQSITSERPHTIHSRGLLGKWVKYNVFYLSVLSVYFYLTIYLSNLSICLSICLSIYLIYLSVCLSVYLSIYPIQCSPSFYLSN